MSALPKLFQAAERAGTGPKRRSGRRLLRAHERLVREQRRMLWFNQGVVKRMWARQLSRDAVQASGVLAQETAQGLLVNQLAELKDLQMKHEYTTEDAVATVLQEFDTLRDKLDEATAYASAQGHTIADKRIAKVLGVQLVVKRKERHDLRLGEVGADDDEELDHLEVKEEMEESQSVRALIRNGVAQAKAIALLESKALAWQLRNGEIAAGIQRCEREQAAALRQAQQLENEKLGLDEHIVGANQLSSSSTRSLLGDGDDEVEEEPMSAVEQKAQQQAKEDKALLERKEQLGEEISSLKQKAAAWVRAAEIESQALKSERIARGIAIDILAPIKRQLRSLTSGALDPPPIEGPNGTAPSHAELVSLADTRAKRIAAAETAVRKIERNIAELIKALYDHYDEAKMEAIRAYTFESADQEARAKESTRAVMLPLRLLQQQMREAALNTQDHATINAIQQDIMGLQWKVAKTSGHMERMLELARLKYNSYEYKQKAHNAMLAAIRANVTLETAATELTKLKATLQGLDGDAATKLARNIQEANAMRGAVADKVRFYEAEAYDYEARAVDIRISREMRMAVSETGKKCANRLDNTIADIREIEAKAIRSMTLPPSEVHYQGPLALGENDNNNNTDLGEGSTPITHGGELKTPGQVVSEVREDMRLSVEQLKTMLQERVAMAAAKIAGGASESKAEVDAAFQTLREKVIDQETNSKEEIEKSPEERLAGKAIQSALRPQRDRLAALKAALGAPMPGEARRELQESIERVNSRIRRTEGKFWDAMGKKVFNETVGSAEREPLEESEAKVAATTAQDAEHIRGQFGRFRDAAEGRMAKETAEKDKETSTLGTRAKYMEKKTDILHAEDARREGRANKGGQEFAASVEADGAAILRQSTMVDHIRAAQVQLDKRSEKERERAIKKSDSLAEERDSKKRIEEEARLRQEGNLAALASQGGVFDIVTAQRMKKVVVSDKAAKKLQQKQDKLLKKTVEKAQKKVSEKDEEESGQKLTLKTLQEQLHKASEAALRGRRMQAHRLAEAKKALLLEKKQKQAAAEAGRKDERKKEVREKKDQKKTDELKSKGRKETGQKSKESADDMARRKQAEEDRELQQKKKQEKEKAAKAERALEWDKAQALEKRFKAGEEQAHKEKVHKLELKAKNQAQLQKVAEANHKESVSKDAHNAALEKLAKRSSERTVEQQAVDDRVTIKKRVTEQTMKDAEAQAQALVKERTKLIAHEKHVKRMEKMTAKQEKKYKAELNVKAGAGETANKVKERLRLQELPEEMKQKSDKLKQLQLDREADEKNRAKEKQEKKQESRTKERSAKKATKRDKIMKEVQQKTNVHKRKVNEVTQKREADFVLERNKLEEDVDATKHEAHMAAEANAHAIVDKDKEERELSQMLGEAESSHKSRLTKELAQKKKKSDEMKELAYKAQVTMNATMADLVARPGLPNITTINIDKTLAKPPVNLFHTTDDTDTMLEALEYQAASECAEVATRVKAGDDALKLAKTQASDVNGLVSTLSGGPAVDAIRSAVQTFAQSINEVQDVVVSTPTVGKQVAVLRAVKKLASAELDDDDAVAGKVSQMRKATIRLLRAAVRVVRSQKRCLSSKSRVLAHKGQELARTSNTSAPLDRLKAAANLLAQPESFTFDVMRSLKVDFTAALSNVSGNKSAIELLQDSLSNVEEWMAQLNSVKQRAIESSSIKLATIAKVNQLLTFMGAVEREEQEKKEKVADEQINQMMKDQSEAAAKEKAQEKEEKAIIAKANEARKRAETSMELKLKKQEANDETKMEAERHSQAPTSRPTAPPHETAAPTPVVPPNVSALSVKLSLVGYNVSSIADFWLVEDSFRESLGKQLSLPTTHIVFRDSTREKDKVHLTMVLMGSAWEGGMQLDSDEVRVTLEAPALVAEVAATAIEQGVGWFPRDGAHIKVDEIIELNTYTLLKKGAYEKKTRFEGDIPPEPALEPVQTWCNGHNGVPYPCTKLSASEHLTFAQKEYLKRPDQAVGWGAEGIQYTRKSTPIVYPHDRWSPESGSNIDPKKLVDVKSWCTQPDGSSAPC